MPSTALPVPMSPLPPLPRHPRAARSHAPQPMRWASMPTMLLVEDSRLTAEVFRLFCRRAAIRLRRAETLAAALAHLRVYRPDVVVVDLGLPDGSGLDLIARLATACPPPARLVAISGDGDRADEAIDAGADAFLAKPMNLFGSAARALGLPALDDSIETDTPSEQAGDPLALIDDLRQARALLDAAESVPGRTTRMGRAPDGSSGGTPPGSDTMRHAVQFSRTLAISLHDDDLLAASQASGPGQGAALRKAIEARLIGHALL